MNLMLASVVYCIVGSNTGSPDLESLKVLACNTETGEANVVQEVKGFQGTTYCQLSSDHKSLYTIIGEKREDKNIGSAVSFAIEGHVIGEMTRLAELPCEAPCHVMLSEDGKRLSFASYLSGTLSALDLSALTAATCPAVRYKVLENIGMGPRADRQKKAYAHCTFYTPDGKTLGACDLGTDHVFFYDPVSFARKDAMTITADPGDGPRHALFSKDGNTLFVVNELSSSVTSYAFDGTVFSKRGKWSMLPEGTDSMSTKAAAIKLTADGKILMASNRGYDSIAFFDVKNDGMLVPRNIAKLCGKFPRDFELLPGEKFMIVGHKMSNEIQVYAFDRATCTLTPVGNPIPCWRPLCFKLI